MNISKPDLTSAVVNGKIYAIGVSIFGLGSTEEYTPSSSVDIGLRFYDGTKTISVACEPDTDVKSPLRIARKINNVTKIYGVMLVDTTDASASQIRIKTKTGVVKAIKKLS